MVISRWLLYQKTPSHMFDRVLNKHLLLLRFLSCNFILPSQKTSCQTKSSQALVSLRKIKINYKNLFNVTTTNDPGDASLWHFLTILIIDWEPMTDQPTFHSLCFPTVNINFFLFISRDLFSRDLFSFQSINQSINQSEFIRDKRNKYNQF